MNITSESQGECWAQGSGFGGWGLEGHGIGNFGEGYGTGLSSSVTKNIKLKATILLTSTLQKHLTTIFHMLPNPAPHPTPHKPKVPSSQIMQKYQIVESTNLRRITEKDEEIDELETFTLYEETCNIFGELGVQGVRGEVELGRSRGRAWKMGKRVEMEWVRGWDGWKQGKEIYVLDDGFTFNYDKIQQNIPVCLAPLAQQPLIDDPDPQEDNTFPPCLTKPHQNKSPMLSFGTEAIKFKNALIKQKLTPINPQSNPPVLLPIPVPLPQIPQIKSQKPNPQKNVNKMIEIGKRNDNDNGNGKNSRRFSEMVERDVGCCLFGCGKEEVCQGNWRGQGSLGVGVGRQTFGGKGCFDGLVDLLDGQVCTSEKIKCSIASTNFNTSQAGQDLTFLHETQSISIRQDTTIIQPHSNPPNYTNKNRLTKTKFNYKPSTPTPTSSSTSTSTRYTNQNTINSLYFCRPNQLPVTVTNYHGRFTK